jgi:hypothetical protein
VSLFRAGAAEGAAVSLDTITIQAVGRYVLDRTILQPEPH